MKREFYDVNFRLPLEYSDDYWEKRYTIKADQVRTLSMPLIRKNKLERFSNFFQPSLMFWSMVQPVQGTNTLAYLSGMIFGLSE